MFLNVFSILYLSIRPLLKWFLHRFTRLTELQRICYGARGGAPRAKGVERSLRLSRTPRIRELVRALDELSEYINSANFESEIVDRAVRAVLVAKKINPRTHPDFPKLFGACVEQIWGYKGLVHAIERLRTTSYDCENSDHERKLCRLWDLLVPKTPLKSRVTKQWQEIGFQGDDPKTDFRGMGLLSLENLLYFAHQYPGTAAHVLSHSMHPRHGYTFAIVGINLTSMAHQLLTTGLAKTHIYNTCRHRPTMNTFHQLYCYLFFEFDRFWMESKPTNIMEFSRIKTMFEENVRRTLASDTALLKMNLSVENI